MATVFSCLKPLRAIFAFVLATLPVVCNAQLAVCNRSGGNVSIALNHDLVTEGWFNVENDECKSILTGPIAAGSAVGIYSDPHTRVRGVVPYGGTGATSWCASRERFSFENRGVIGHGCPSGFDEVTYITYVVDVPQITWTLEPDPFDLMKSTTSRGGDRTSEDKQPKEISQPTWTAIKSTKHISLTSKYGRKDHTFQFYSDPDFMVCTYRLRELSSIGNGNHYELTNAYTNTELSVSVAPDNSTSIANGTAEIYNGNKARVRIDIDWYLIRVSQPPSAAKRKAALDEMSQILREGDEVWTAAENAPIRRAFVGGTWPRGIACGDRPKDLKRKRSSAPPPSGLPPELKPKPSSKAVTLRIHCKRVDSNIIDGAEREIQGYGKTCSEAVTDAQSQHQRQNICRVGRPELTDGPGEWIDTLSCKAPN